MIDTKELRVSEMHPQEDEAIAHHSLEDIVHHPMIAIRLLLAEVSESYHMLSIRRRIGWSEFHGFL